MIQITIYVVKIWTIARMSFERRIHLSFIFFLSDFNSDFFGGDCTVLLPPHTSLAQETYWCTRLSLLFKWMSDFHPQIVVTSVALRQLKYGIFRSVHR